MAATVSDFLVDRLYAWGVHRIFGYPGDGINGVFGALNRAEGKTELVLVRRESLRKRKRSLVFPGQDPSLQVRP
jgi:pyruvate dehydrogenase (quinone)